MSMSSEETTSRAPDATAPQARPESQGEVVMNLWRGDAEGGEFVEYVMPAQEGEVVLDVIHRVQATAAPDLACRWNCKAGKCGSCSVEINGKPRLMCMTRMDQLPEGPVTVTPMKAFPIIRDRVERIVTVREESILAAMRFIWERAKLVIEPSSAVPLAVLWERQVDLAGLRVGVILTGGNVDLDRLPWQA